MVEFCNENSTYILSFHKFMISVKDISLNIRDAFQVGWANQHRSLYFVKKGTLKDQRQVSSPGQGSGAKPLEAERDENSMYLPISAVSTTGQRKSEMITGMNWI